MYSTYRSRSIISVGFYFSNAILERGWNSPPDTLMIIFGLIRNLFVFFDGSGDYLAYSWPFIPQECCVLGRKLVRQLTLTWGSRKWENNAIMSPLRNFYRQEFFSLTRKKNVRVIYCVEMGLSMHVKWKYYKFIYIRYLDILMFLLSFSSCFLSQRVV